MTGFGESNDPAYRLKLLASEVENESKIQKRRRKRAQSGGLAPIAIPIIASIVGALSGRIFDAIKEKIKGSGYELPKLKTKGDKHNYVLKLFKSI